MQSFGRKNVVVLGASLMTLSTAIFGLAAFFKSPWGFILVSTLARIIQGVADACITVTMPSIICREFPKN
jgi:MFS family permease